MDILFIGDIVGESALQHLASRLPSMRRECQADVVIANAENCAVTAPNPYQGYGMRVDLIERLFASGVDIVTSGNHAWDGPEMQMVHRHPMVLRPLNVPDGWPGRGMLEIDLAGQPLRVLVLASKTALMPDALPPLPAYQTARRIGATTLVEFHGDNVTEKASFAFAVDGQVAAVLGTHTHEPTSILHVLPQGTVFVAEVGMTGHLGGIQGADHDFFVRLLREQDPSTLPPFKIASGPIMVSALHLRAEAGRAPQVRRLEQPR